MVIVGYPKSGNTWVTYLASYTFQLDYNDLDASPGVYPKEPQLRELLLSFNSDEKLHKTHKLARSRFDSKRIALFRHPFDVAVSEYHYRRNFVPNQSLFSKPWKLGRFATITLQRLKRMAQIDSPSHEISATLDRWAKFAIDCLNEESEIQVLKYEDFKNNAVGELQKLNEAWRLNSSVERMERAVELFHFNRLKEIHLKNKKKGFYRKGISGEGMKIVPKEVQERFFSTFHEPLEKLKYEINC